MSSYMVSMVVSIKHIDTQVLTTVITVALSGVVWTCNSSMCFNSAFEVQRVLTDFVVFWVNTLLCYVYVFVLFHGKFVKLLTVAG